MTIPELHHASGYTAMVAATALAAVATLTYSIRTLRRRSTNRPPAAVLVAALAAAACTAYSADTSWRFAADHLGMRTVTERAAMFAAAELALFSVALMARQNLRGPAGTPGTPGVLVWVITGVQVIPAFSESGLIGGFVRAFVGPVLAALLWHLAMGIELRHAKPGANNQALWALIAREARERLMSRLGLAVRDRTAEQITRDRWTQRAVAYAARLSEFGPKPTGRLDRRRAIRLAHRLSIAVGRAQVGADPGQRQMLLSLLAARRHAGALATMELASPWDIPADPAVVRADVDPRTTPDTPRVLPGGQPRTVLSAAPDITADARADRGADTPLSSADAVRPAATDVTANPPSVAALVRSCLDSGADSTDAVVSAVRAVRPDADIPTVKRTLRRERDKRTTYM